ILEGKPDPAGGCTAAATSCSGADTCVGGHCLPNDVLPGTACATCKGCNGTGTCNLAINEGKPDLVNGCTAAATSCSGADTCVSGNCVPNDLAPNTPCAPCKGCNGTGTCNQAILEGKADPNGCNTGATSCSNADTCVGGNCVPNDKAAGTTCGTC